MTLHKRAMIITVTIILTDLYVLQDALLKEYQPLTKDILDSIENMFDSLFRLRESI